MFKRTVLRSAAILMVLAYTPALEAKVPDAPLFQNEFICSPRPAKAFGDKIWESMKKFGKSVCSFPKKHPAMFSLILTGVFTAVSVGVTSAIHDAQLESLREKIDLDIKIGSHAHELGRDINNMLVTHIVDSFNADSEMRLDLDSHEALLKQLLWDVSQLNKNSYTTEPTVTLVR